MSEGKSFWRWYWTGSPEAKGRLWLLLMILSMSCGGIIDIITCNDKPIFFIMGISGSFIIFISPMIYSHFKDMKEKYNVEQEESK